MNNLGSIGGSSTSAPLTKQQMLAKLKAQAQARKAKEGDETPPDTIKLIESTTKPVTVRVQGSGNQPSMKTVGRAQQFLSRLGANQRATTSETKAVYPFATIADPEVLVEANVAPSTEIFELETGLPDSLRPDYEHFTKVCEERNIPAGIMGLLWKHLLNDITIIDIDTSFSMSQQDGHSPEEPKSALEKNYNVEILDFGENNVGNSTPPASSRMEEAKSRLIQIMPILCAANRQGIVHLKSYSDPRGIRLDAKNMSAKQMVDETTNYIERLRSDMDHTPSVSSYYDSCVEAVDSMRRGETKSATIIEATDGEPNQRVKPEFENIYQQYEQKVINRGRDYVRADGRVISNREARTWNMDSDTPRLMRRLSVLAGHFALPTTFAACTDKDYEIGELNEVDQIHNTVATLDDFKNEQKEVLKAQGPRVPFNLATYMALYFIAPKEHFLDQLDENPFTPEQLVYSLL